MGLVVLVVAVTTSEREETRRPSRRQSEKSGYGLTLFLISLSWRLALDDDRWHAVVANQSVERIDVVPQD